MIRFLVCFSLLNKNVTPRDSWFHGIMFRQNISNNTTCIWGLHLRKILIVQKKRHHTNYPCVILNRNTFNETHWNGLTGVRPSVCIRLEIIWRCVWKQASFQNVWQLDAKGRTTELEYPWSNTTNTLLGTSQPSPSPPTYRRNPTSSHTPRFVWLYMIFTAMKSHGKFMVAVVWKNDDFVNADYFQLPANTARGVEGCKTKWYWQMQPAELQDNIQLTDNDNIN